MNANDKIVQEDDYPLNIDLIHYSNAMKFFYKSPKVNLFLF